MPVSLGHPDYATVKPIAEAIVAAAGNLAKLDRLLSDVLRSAIDGVIKTPKTGRRFYSDLQNSEKTYIGTCVEIDLWPPSRFRVGRGLT